MPKIYKKNWGLFKEIVQTNNLGDIYAFEGFNVLPQFGKGIGFTAKVEGDKYNILDEKIFLQASIAGSLDFLVVFESKKYDIYNSPELFKYRPRSQQWIEIYKNKNLSSVYIATDEGKHNTVTTFIFEYNWVEEQGNVCMVFSCSMDDLNIANQIKKMCESLKYPTKSCTMEFIEQQSKYKSLFNMPNKGLLNFNS